MRLLLVNPNTSEHITQRLVTSARRVLPSGSSLTAITATGGPAAVRSAAEVQAATHNVMHMVREHGAGYDAVLLGISLDCGLWEVRERCHPLPVVGMTEAACLMACVHAPRFGLLTLGQQMAPLYQAHVNRLGLSSRMAALAAPDAPRAFDAAPDLVVPEMLDLLTQAARTTLDQGAGCVVLAGAVLCGYGPALEERLGRPVLDGMACAVVLAGARLALARG